MSRSSQSHSWERNLMYYGVFVNLNVQLISPGGKDRLPQLLYTFYPVGVYFYNQGGDAIIETQFLHIQCFTIAVSFVLLCSLVFNSKKVGASIKNPLLGLKQPWGLRCGLYKEFNIWSMADLCTLPWLFVLTVPCRDCLPTLPDLRQKRKKETDGEWLQRRSTMHSFKLFKVPVNIVNILPSMKITQQKVCECLVLTANSESYQEAWLPPGRMRLR